MIKRSVAGSLWRRSWIIACLPLIASAATAAKPSEQWLPARTKFHLSVPDFPTSKGIFDQTDWGRFFADPAMQPFLEELPGQLQDKAPHHWLNLLWLDLEIDRKLLAEAANGEMGWALIATEETSPARVLFVDVTEKATETETFSSALAGAMDEKQAQSSTRTAGGIRFTVYDLPPRGDAPSRRLVYFIQDEVLVFTEDVGLALELGRNLSAPPSDNLAANEAYQHAMRRCAAEAEGMDVHGRIFAVPFAVAELLVEMSVEKQPDRVDRLKLLRKHGFDALSAVGIHVTLNETSGEVRFVAFLSAPKPWSQSMKMVDLPNADLAPPTWIPAKATACGIWNQQMAPVFRHLGPLYEDFLAEGYEGAWQEFKDALRSDPQGPQVDVDKEIFRYLTGPVVVFQQTKLPPSSDSVRLVAGFKASDEKALAAGVDKMLRDDPVAEVKMVAGRPAYYSVDQDDEQELLWIVCVGRSYLLMASNFDLLEQVLNGPSASPLADAQEYAQVADAWTDELGRTSVNAFYRLDEWLHARYELFRKGERLAERTSFGGLLNNFAAGESFEETEEITEELGGLDGSKLPPYEQVKKYFGIFWAAAKTGEDGWLLVGSTGKGT